MFERILVPLDGSRFSAQALDYAIEIAKRFSSETILIRVVIQATYEDVISLSAEADKISKEGAQLRDKRNVEQAKRYLSAQLQQLTAQGVKGSTHVVVGNPPKLIIQFCKKENVDLAVMTTHGKSGIKRAVLGSVADELIREPGLPILAIRPSKQNRK